MSRDRPFSGCYLAELFAPRCSPEKQRAEVRRVHAAAAALAATGVRVRHLHSTYIPGDETAFHLFEADWPDSVERVLHEAGLEAERISPAIAAPEEGSEEARVTGEGMRCPEPLVRR